MKAHVEDANALVNQYIREDSSGRIYKITAVETEGCVVQETEGMFLPAVPEHDDTINFITWAAAKNLFSILVQADDIKGLTS